MVSPAGASTLKACFSGSATASPTTRPFDDTYKNTCRAAAHSSSGYIAYHAVECGSTARHTCDAAGAAQIPHHSCCMWLTARHTCEAAGAADCRISSISRHVIYMLGRCQEDTGCAHPTVTAAAAEHNRMAHPRLWYRQQPASSHAVSFLHKSAQLPHLHTAHCAVSSQTALSPIPLGEWRPCNGCSTSHDLS